jgi:hypothetical protein
MEFVQSRIKFSVQQLRYELYYSGKGISLCTSCPYHVGLSDSSLEKVSCQIRITSNESKREQKIAKSFHHDKNDSNSKADTH